MALPSAQPNSMLFQTNDTLRTARPGLQCPADKFLPLEHDCAFCGKSSFNLKSCTNCWAAKYCDKPCQVSHWPVHCTECRKDVTRRNMFTGGRMVEMELVSSDESMEASVNEDAIFLDLDKCPKNGYNDHANFIPVKEFNLNHLPEDIRHQRVAYYILAESKTTVRVLVKWTSKNRPETDACARWRGTKSTRTASGKFVLDNPHEFQIKDCPIPHCHRKKDLGQAHKIFEGDLKIFTNKHVLYDEEELKHTEVDFFYDSADKVGLIKEYATHLFYTKPSSDKTFLKVTIHDEALFHTLEQIDNDKCQAFWKLPPLILKRMSGYAIVISHPHGLPKKVSIGRVVRVTAENVTDETQANAKEAGLLESTWFQTRSEEDYKKYMAGLGRLNLPVYKVWYDTPTCQGSSGSPVIFGGRQCNGTWGPYMAFHSAYDVDSNLNYFKVVRFMD